MSAHLGEVFHMGGLAGVPFTGKTGFAAFSHHIPDGGNLFILFAPHVGLSKQGKVGEYSRFGQAKDGKVSLSLNLHVQPLHIPFTNASFHTQYHISSNISYHILSHVVLYPYTGMWSCLCRIITLFGWKTYTYLFRTRGRSLRLSTTIHRR